MSVREEIQDGREAGILRSGIIYTEVLGWIDMGHARGDDVRKLLSDMHQSDETSFSSSCKRCFTLIHEHSDTLQRL